MKKVLKLAVLLCFAFVLMLTIASCKNSGETELTSPVQTTTSHVHTEEIITGIKPTCVENGLTEGKKCSECGEELLAQEIIPFAHQFENDVCTVCGARLAYDLEFTLNDDGESYSVTGIGTCKDANIVIPSSYESLPITAIGKMAFNFCSDLVSITIPESVISIGDSAFTGCGLTSIVISDSVTSIGDSAFAACRSLTNITIPNGVTSIGDGAFAYCGSITNITISESVISIGDRAFIGCGLTSVVIPNGVTSIGNSVFAYCGSLTNITFGNSITSIGDEAFCNCGLTSIVIPSSVTNIGKSAFTGCNILTSIMIPDSVISIGELAFRGCNSLTSITVAEGNSVYHSKNNCLIDTASKTLIMGCMSSIIPNDGSVTIIKERAFEECDGLTSITIPDSVTTLGSSAFAFCKKLSEVTLGSALRDIGRSAFLGCSSLTSITIPDNVITLGVGAFSNCTMLSEVVLGTSLQEIGDGAFDSCVNLASITIPDSVTILGSSDDTFLTYGTFRGCSTLSKVILGSSLQSIGAITFSNCSSLTDIAFAGTVDQWNAIELGHNWNSDVPAAQVTCSDGTVKLN